MSVFSSGPDSGYAKADVALGRCKRDYEAEIKRVRETKQSCTDFLAALYKYVDESGTYHETKPFTLGELIGRLELELRAGDRIISNLIAEQEREK